MRVKSRLSIRVIGTFLKEHEFYKEILQFLVSLIDF